MPELPEVETTVRGLQPILNSIILNIKINTPKLRFYIPKDILLLKKVKIKEIKRRAKYIIIDLNNNFSIILHLGMSGRIRLFSNNNFIKQKHDHFIMRTNTDHLLIFNDPRRFGFIDYDKTLNIYKKKYIFR